MRLARHLVALVALAALSAALVAAQLTVTITVDKPMVAVGQTVTITVSTDPPTPNLPIIIEVYDPRGNLWEILPEQPTGADGKVVVTWTVSPGAPAGTWTLKAYVSGQPGVTDTTTVTVLATPVVGGAVVEGSGLELAAASVASMASESAPCAALCAAALVALALAARVARRE